MIADAKRVLWWFLLLCFHGLKLGSAGSLYPLVKDAPAVSAQLDAHDARALPNLGVSLHLRGGLEMTLERERTIEDPPTSSGVVALNKRSRSPELEKALSSASASRNCAGPSMPKRTRVRSASADRRRRMRSASPRVPYTGGDTVWRSGATLGLSGMNVPCEGRVDEPIIDVLDTLDNVSWPHRSIRELKNDGMDEDAVAFLQGSGDATPVGRAAKEWAMQTMGVQPRRGRERRKTPASLARAQARMAEIAASLHSLPPSLDQEAAGRSGGEAAGAEAAGAGEGGAGEESRRRVLLSDVPEGATAEEVTQALGAFGEVESVRIHGALLFACATFRSEEASAAVLQRGFVNFRGFQLDVKPAPEFQTSARPSAALEPNATVMVSRVRKTLAPPSGTGIKSVGVVVERRWVETDAQGQLREAPFAENTVVVHGLSPQANETSIRRAFAKCGRIVSAELGDLVEGKSKYAVVRFCSELSMQRAALMDGTRIGGREVRIRVQGQTKSFIDAMNDMNTEDVDAQMEHYLQTSNLPGSGQK